MGSMLTKIHLAFSIDTSLISDICFTDIAARQSLIIAPKPHRHRMYGNDKWVRSVRNSGIKKTQI